MKKEAEDKARRAEERAKEAKERAKKAEERAKEMQDFVDELMATDKKNPLLEPELLLAIPERHSKFLVRSNI